MTWTLAIDFGTTATAAATYDGDVELIQVDGMARLPSLVLLGSDGEPVCGAAAERQAAGVPERVERTPKRRLGDRMLLLGDRAVDPVDLVAAVLRKVADEARRRQGGTAPDHVVLTHPAAWVGARLAALREAARRADLGEVVLLPEPVAAAIHLADDRIATGDHVVVYDLGGGTFDTAILRRTPSGFEPVGAPGGDEHLGGEDFDELLYDAVGAVLERRDPERWQLLRSSEERSWVRANAALREEIRAAKEALSSTVEYTVYVPMLDEEVRITRQEVEDLVRPALERSVDELVATVERAGLGITDVKAVYLVGGSSRIPLASRLISERTGLVPLTWGDPKAAVALGAAQRGGTETSPVVLTAPPPSPDVAVPAAPPVGLEAPVAPNGKGRKAVLAAVALAIVMALLALVAVLPDGAKEGEVASRGGPSTTTTVGPNGELEHRFPPSQSDGVRLERTWLHDPTTHTLSNELIARNLDDEKAKSSTLFEVIPKEVAADVSLVTFDPQPVETVQPDPVVRYMVDLEPGGTVQIRWSVATSGELDADGLASLAAARDGAEKAFFERLQALGGGELADGVLAPGPTVPARTGSTVTVPSGSSGGTGGDTGGSGGGGSGGGGSGDGGTGTTVTVRTTEATGTVPPTNTTPGSTTTSVLAPSAVAGLTASEPVGEDIQGGVPARVRVTLKWLPPSDNGGQAPTGYRIRCTTMLASHAYGTEPNETLTVPCRGGVQHSTTSGFASQASVVEDRIDPGPLTWMKWEVAAVNSGGTGPYRTAQVVVPSVLGLFSWEAWPIVRGVGLDAEGTAATTCGRTKGQMCTQSRPEGAVVSSGVDFIMAEQG